MRSENPYTVTLSKLQVVERQLDTAVWLWFHSGDLVSILTLTGAAMGVLDGLLFAATKRRPHPLTQSFVPQGMTIRAWRKKVHSAESFAKHARNDPKDAYEFKEYWIATYLYMTLLAHAEFAQPYDWRSLPGIFATWYGINFTPETPAMFFLTDDAYKENLSKVDRAKKLTRTRQAAGDRFPMPPAPDGLRV